MTDRPVLTHKEFRALLGVSKSTFYTYQRAGLFTRLEAPVPHRYSRAKVEAWLAGKPKGRVA